MKEIKAIVLSSGGNDSTAVLSQVIDAFGSEHVATLSIYYGQKHDKEIACARQIAKHYGVRHFEYDLAEIFRYSESTLLKGRSDIEESSYEEQIKKTEGKAPVATYVPYRNGLMLSTAAALADELGASHIYYGAHADDAVGNAYPDCSETFVEYQAKTIFEGTGGAVELHAPIIRMNKSQVLALGLKYHAPMQLTWSCYQGGEKQCGLCGTCRDRIQAYKNNGVIDPVPYEIEIDWADCLPISEEKVAGKV